MFQNWHIFKQAAIIWLCLFLLFLKHGGSHVCGWDQQRGGDQSQDNTPFCHSIFFSYDLLSIHSVLVKHGDRIIADSLIGTDKRVIRERVNIETSFLVTGS